MKTFQQVLKESDTNLVIDNYLDKIYDEIMHSKDNYNETIQDLLDMARIRISQYINRLLSLQITPSDQVSILLCYECLGMDDYLTNPYCTLIHQDELMSSETLDDIETYAYEFTNQSEILGFLVAENKYTTDHIEDLITDVLYEASFFGYNEESKDEENKKLKDAIEEIELGEAKLIPFEQVRKDLGFVDTPKDEKEKELYHVVCKAINEHNKYTLKRELIIIKQQIANTSCR